jgi:hypothetical protein
MLDFCSLGIAPLLNMAVQAHSVARSDILTQEFRVTTTAAMTRALWRLAASSAAWAALRFMLQVGAGPKRARASQTMTRETTTDSLQNAQNPQNIALLEKSFLEWGVSRTCRTFNS